MVRFTIVECVDETQADAGMINLSGEMPTSENSTPDLWCRGGSEGTAGIVEFLVWGH